MLKNLLKATHDFFWEHIPKPFREFFCEKYPYLGWVLFVALIVGCPLLFDLDFKLNGKVQEAALINMAERGSIPEDESIGTGGADHFVFVDEWHSEDWDSFVSEGDAVLLQKDYTRTMFTYSSLVPLLEEFHIDFVSEGVTTSNLAFGRSDFYEVVIGDGENDVLTVKAKQKVKGELVEIPESSIHSVLSTEMNPLRPRMAACTIANGEETQVDVKEQYSTETNEFLLTVIVYCKGTLARDVFSFLFKPTPTWEKKQTVYIGLLDYSEGQSNKTKIYFLEPDITARLREI